MVLMVLRGVSIAAMRAWRPVRHVLRAARKHFAAAAGPVPAAAATMPIGHLR